MPEPGVYSDSFFAMGTRCDVLLADVDEESGEQVLQLVKNKMIQIESQLSRFIPQSPISRLNRAGKGEWLYTSQTVWEVLTICYDFFQVSNGVFDITLAPLINLWKANHGGGQIPGDEIERAKAICGFDKVVFDFEKQRLRFLSDGVGFDLGGIGKGFAIDTIKKVLLNQKIERAIINLGDSSVLALGQHPNGEDWPIGIRNAYSKNEYIHVFQVNNETVTTSGTVYNTEKNKKGVRLHIINPLSGKPIESPCSVSVKSDSATFGEFLATTWVILPEYDKKILSEKCRKVETLEINYKSESDFETKLTIL
ncbi:hypothetical protein MNBD_BACTEROID01-2451 [hydrothermal vent metagenome]|uniref:FAD:protein FMN transferase n=1 Tax=hydrothermal vent metagenome TaxID=652676 RepID=A0A3B0UPQ1_9ZZZZ